MIKGKKFLLRCWKYPFLDICMSVIGARDMLVYFRPSLSLKIKTTKLWLLKCMSNPTDSSGYKITANLVYDCRTLSDDKATATDRSEQSSRVFKPTHKLFVLCKLQLILICNCGRNQQLLSALSPQIIIKRRSSANGYFQTALFMSSIIQDISPIFLIHLS